MREQFQRPATVALICEVGGGPYFFREREITFQFRSHSVLKCHFRAGMVGCKSTHKCCLLWFPGGRWCAICAMSASRACHVGSLQAASACWLTEFPPTRSRVRIRLERRAIADGLPWVAAAVLHLNDQSHKMKQRPVAPAIVGDAMGAADSEPSVFKNWRLV